MKKMQTVVGWCAGIVFWMLGAFLLQRIWSYQKSLPDPAGSYIEFTVMFLVTFYIFALFPIKYCVDWFLRRFGLFESPDRNFDEESSHWGARKA